MFVVAVAELHGGVEAEATALAGDLGCSPYDARLLLAPGTPAVVKTTPDRAQAAALLERLRARGHGAVAFDAAAVVGSSAMVSMRRFHLEGDALTVEGPPALRLPYGDVLALVAAVHRSRTASETRSKERQLSVGRALMTSGLALTKTVTRQARAASEDREHVLYVFRRSGEAPWLLRELGTSWAGLGDPMAATALDNLRMTVDALRARATSAVFDDRLLSRRAAERATLSTGAATTSIKTSSDAGVDVLAHVVALWTARATAYR
jgi:hypothetical protein